MHRIHIIGRKNCGKTTLIVELVQHLVARGHRVATIKHTHHRHELDTPGKDSHRHRQAGAAAVGILSPGMNAVFWPALPDQDISDRYDRFAACFADCELVLVEGHSQTTAPKVEVWRAGASSEGPIAETDRSIVAVVTNDPVAATLEVWPLGDLPALARRLLRLARKEL